jgi:hypothetical protein
MLSLTITGLTFVFKLTNIDSEDKRWTCFHGDPGVGRARCHETSKTVEVEAKERCGFRIVFPGGEPIGIRRRNELGLAAIGLQI